MNNNPCQACSYSPSAKVTPLGIWELSVNLLSGNKIGANNRQGWAYRNAKQRYHRALNLHQGPELATPHAKRRLIITRYYKKRKREYDADNMNWGCKPLVDLLVSRGWLFDDDPKHVERIYKQKPSDTEFDHVHIELYEFH